MITIAASMPEVVSRLERLRITYTIDRGARQMRDTPGMMAAARRVGVSWHALKPVRRDKERDGEGSGSKKRYSKQVETRWLARAKERYGGIRRGRFKAAR